MAFFDDIGKRISQTGQSAVQKTKEMADVAKINTVISDEERRLNNNYIQIGRLYVELHSDDYEQAFADMMTEIKDAEKKIDEYKQQIQDIKGVIRCEHCGAEIPNIAAFCSACGTAVPRQQVMENDPSKILCIGCGQMIPGDVKFCTSCGRAVTDSIQAQQQNLGEKMEDAAGLGESSKRVCANCGVEIEDDSRFCTSCGQPVS